MIIFQLVVWENDTLSNKESIASHEYGSFIEKQNSKRFKFNQSENGSRNYHTDCLNKDKENVDPQQAYQTFKGSVWSMSFGPKAR